MSNIWRTRGSRSNPVALSDGMRGHWQVAATTGDFVLDLDGGLLISQQQTVRLVRIVRCRIGKYGKIHVAADGTMFTAHTGLIKSIERCDCRVPARDQPVRDQQGETVVS